MSHPAVEDRKHPATTDLQRRSATYHVFAQLFRESPTREFLKAVVRDRLLPEPDPAWPDQAEAIVVEYARLFAVPGAQAVHPYESAYCDALSIDTSTACSTYFGSQRPIVGLPGFIGGPSASAVARAYADAGFELDPTKHELPDHLAVELEFMGRLLERGEHEQAKTFFTEHPARWAFRCLEDMKRNAQAGFYQRAADTLATFLQDERQFLR